MTSEIELVRGFKMKRKSREIGDYKILRDRAQQRIENESEDKRHRRLENDRIRAGKRLANEHQHARNVRRQRNAENLRNARIINENNIVRVDSLTFNEADIEKHSIGDFNMLCQFCAAKHFLAERPSDEKFNNCCHKGRVPFHPRRPFPEYMQNILIQPDHPHYRNFKTNIRSSYNLALSFASMGAQVSEPPGYGPYCFRVYGQIYHQT